MGRGLFIQKDDKEWMAAGQSHFDSHFDIGCLDRGFAPNSNHFRQFNTKRENPEILNYSEGSIHV